MHFQNAALLSCLSAVSMTMPVKAPRDDHITLWEEDATCSSTGNQGVPGLLMAVDSNGAPVPCSEMEYASSSSSVIHDNAFGFEELTYTVQWHFVLCHDR